MGENTGETPMAVGEVFIFFRAEGWYPITLRSAKDVAANAECNPGTLRVEDVNGRVIWRASASR